VVLALRQWGEDWGHGTQEVQLADQRDGKPVRPIRVLAQDGRELGLRACRHGGERHAGSRQETHYLFHYLASLTRTAAGTPAQAARKR
jgi:IS5 family transposase